MHRFFVFSLISCLFLVAGWAVLGIHCGDSLHSLSGNSACAMTEVSHGLYHIEIFTAALSAHLAEALWALSIMALLLISWISAGRTPIFRYRRLDARSGQSYGSLQQTCADSPQRLAAGAYQKGYRKRLSSLLREFDCLSGLQPRHGFAWSARIRHFSRFQRGSNI